MSAAIARNVAAVVVGFFAIFGLGGGPARAETPQVDYMLHCRGCHLADGAQTAGAVPPLRDSVARFLTVPGGREYLVRVPGSAQAPLDDAALAAVLNWIVREFGPADALDGFAPYTPAEVARLRSAPLVDVEGTRRALVAAMDEPGD